MRTANPSSWFLAGCALLLLVASIAECIRRYERNRGLFPAAEAWKAYFVEPDNPTFPITTKKETTRVEKAVAPNP